MFQNLLSWLETKKGFYISLVIISVLFSGLRFINISFPSSRVFDEVYSPAFAWKWIHGEDYFDIHPALAELPHTLGLRLFGDVPLAWRFGPWLWSFLLTWTTAFIAYLLFKQRLAGIIASLLFSLDSAMFVYGRTGLPDMFLLLQIALAVLFLLLCVRTNNPKFSMWYALACGFFMGNVVATKWFGLGIFGVIWLWLILFNFRKTELPKFSRWLCPVFFLVVPAAVYFLWLFPILRWQGDWPQTWTRIVWWHNSVWGYNTSLTATHPYSSAWWQWPLLLKPVLFYWQQEDGGRRVINSIGNIAIWWAGFGVLAGSAFILIFRNIRKFFRLKLNAGSVLYYPDSSILTWLVFSVLGFWLPWAVVGRVLFNYHFFPAFLFELLLLTGLIIFALKNNSLKPFVAGFILTAVVIFIIQYPSATAVWIPNSLKPIPFLMGF